MTDQHVLAVPAIIDIADESKTQWSAHGIPGSPFSGLFALGDDFKSARQAFAEVVADAVTHGAVTIEGFDPKTLAAVRVLATTRKTFPVDNLDEQT